MSVLKPMLRGKNRQGAIKLVGRLSCDRCLSSSFVCIGASFVCIGPSWGQAEVMEKNPHVAQPAWMKVLLETPRSGPACTSLLFSVDAITRPIS